jgi:hypothetical protein
VGKDVSSKLLSLAIIFCKHLDALPKMLYVYKWTTFTQLFQIVIQDCVVAEEKNYFLS